MFSPLLDMTYIVKYGLKRSLRKSWRWMATLILLHATNGFTIHTKSVCFLKEYDQIVNEARPLSTDADFFTEMHISS